MGRKLVIDDALFTRAGLGSLNWTPIQLNPDLALWVRSDDVNNLTVDGANRVLSLKDSRVGAGQTVMLPLNPANKMLRVAAEQNGKPGIKQDDGTARILTAGHHEELNFEWDQPFSVSACIKYSGNYGSMICQGNAGGGQLLTGWEVGFVPRPVVQLLNYSGSYSLLVMADANLTEGATCILHYTYDGSGTPAGIKLYKNGVLLEASTIANNLGGRSIKSSTLSQLCLNGEQSGGTTTPCSYYELALTKRVISAGERAAFDTYLNTRWAVY